MPESDIKQLYMMLTEMKAAQARIQTDINYLRENSDKMQRENEARDKHIHNLEIAKREAWAVAGFIGLLVGLIVPVFFTAYR